eukprot:TRINITY_DN62876_c0_g1_i1.p1 TRINITY_DN62876_c0_g1~~TRINITY_DN62876_c0_g1_i1.p1  ORF type:complete len:435 (-),score=64.73 TRINITY_DN62876_c0_g1_i1:79-1338(-)
MARAVAPCIAAGTAQERLDRLDAVFGPSYFQHGRLVITAARDINGCMKVAHKLQSKINERFAAIVEVIMEHVKYEWWVKLHETTTMVGVQKGSEVPDCQVTDIPEGVRVHPYKREAIPSLEVLLLWEDTARRTRGYCIYSMSHPEAPALEQVDSIFASIEPYFAKRWVDVQLRLGPPVRGEFDSGDAGAAADAEAYDTHVGSGVSVTLLACHADGFARGQAEGATHVRNCRPMVFEGLTDDAGIARMCFLPAEINKIQVAETAIFHGREVMLPKSEINDLGRGPTPVSVVLTPKALAAVSVHVFELPAKLPPADDVDGVIDWAAERREFVAGASVQVAPLDGGDAVRPTVLRREGDTDAFVVADGGGLPEGCVTLAIEAPGFEPEERVVMLLLGTNDFYVPMRKLRCLRRTGGRALSHT